MKGNKVTIKTGRGESPGPDYQPRFQRFDRTISRGLHIRTDVSAKSAIGSLKRHAEANGRTLKVKKRKGRLRRLRNPAGFERQYKKLLADRRRNLRERLEEVLIPQLPEIVDMVSRTRPTTDGIQIRNDETYPERVVKLTELVKAQHNAVFTQAELRAQLTGLATGLAGQSRENLELTIKSAIGVDVLASEPWLAAELAQFVETNMKLVESAEARHMAKIEESVLRSARQGLRHEELATRIRDIDPAANFNLIARDQIGSFNGQLNELRQKDVGVKRYIWRTSGDERVRDEHVDRDGETFSWNEPPEDGHPGQPINCRCYSEPVLEDLIEGS